MNDSGLGGTVQYCSPAHGGWGMVRVGMLVPESYQLFVCPFACGRHGAIGAIRQGLKQRLSYLYIDEGDIVSGGYEDLILESVDELLEHISPRPKVLMIFVSCLDDLLGTDHGALVARLSEKHPDLRFTFCHMNPIASDGELPPPVNIQRKIYGLLEAPHQNGSDGTDFSVNFIGNHVPVAPSSDIFELLECSGISKTRHLSQCRTFEEFQEMSQARLNIVLAPAARKASLDMWEHLKIDNFFMPVQYHHKRVERSFSALEEMIFRLRGQRPASAFNFEEKNARVWGAVKRALGVLEKRPVVVDSSATVRPFEMARSLLEYGFNVTTVLASACIPIERENFVWVKEKGVDILDPQHHNILFQKLPGPECVAVGFESAYFTKSRNSAGMVNDETLCGTAGIVTLMESLISAAQTESELQGMIERYGLVI